MRYVTITKSRFYNNGTGIVPNAIDGEKFPPPEDNAIVDNDIFWNNFNFHQGKPPFKVRETGLAALVPIGTGVLLFGGRDTLVENNRIYGNFLAGFAALDSFMVEDTPEAAELKATSCATTPSGSTTRTTTATTSSTAATGPTTASRSAPTDTALDRSTLSPCQGKNTFSQAAQDQMVQLGRRERHQGLEAARAPAQAGHQAAGGVRRVKSQSLLSSPASRSWARRRRWPPPSPRARRSGRDNYFVPDAVKVKSGATVTWKWPGFDEASGDVHDVKLKSGPKGVKKFHSQPAAADFTFKRKLKVRGQVQGRLHAPRGDAHDDPRAPLAAPQLARVEAQIVAPVRVPVVAVVAARPGVDGRVGADDLERLRERLVARAGTGPCRRRRARRGAGRARSPSAITSWAAKSSASSNAPGAVSPPLRHSAGECPPIRAETPPVMGGDVVGAEAAHRTPGGSPRARVDTEALGDVRDHLGP